MEVFVPTTSAVSIWTKGEQITPDNEAECVTGDVVVVVFEDGTETHGCFEGVGRGGFFLNRADRDDIWIDLRNGSYFASNSKGSKLPAVLYKGLPA